MSVSSSQWVSRTDLACKRSRASKQTMELEVKGVGRSVAHKTLDYNPLHPCLLALLAEVHRSQQQIWRVVGFLHLSFLKKMEYNSFQLLLQGWDGLWINMDLKTPRLPTAVIKRSCKWSQLACLSPTPEVLWGYNLHLQVVLGLRITMGSGFPLVKTWLLSCTWLYGLFCLTSTLTQWELTGKVVI